MLSFDELTTSLGVGDVIHFCEYKMDRHERLKLAMEIENGIVKEIFPPNTTLNRDQLIEIYGEELDDITYMTLSQSNCPRILVSLGTDANGVEQVKMISISKDFYNTKQQTLEVTGNMANINYEPSYVLAQGGWN